MGIKQSNLKYLGKLKLKTSRQIKDSRLSIGFETLDRDLFDPKRTYGPLSSLGVKWARVQTGWAKTEKVKGVYDFDWLDEIVDELLNIGIKPWFNVTYGNPLYSRGAEGASVGWAPVFSKGERLAWRKFVAALVRHFKGRVKCYEVWNEPDISTFWKPGRANPDHYTELVKLTSKEIRKNFPQAFIIAGSICRGVKSPVGLSFLERCLKNGMGKYINAVAFHSYSLFPEECYAGGISALRYMINKYSPGLQMWMGEGGVPSKTMVYGALSNYKGWNEARQVKHMLRRIMTDLKHDLNLISYFMVVDLFKYFGKLQFYGLLRGKDYSKKPSYFAFQSLCNIFDSKTVRSEAVQVNVRDIKYGTETAVNSETAGFIKNGSPLFVYWYPSSVMKSYKPKLFNLNLWYDCSLRFKDPVLIDPASQKVYSIKKSRLSYLDPKINNLEVSSNKKEFSKKIILLENLPLMDYPLIIADKSIISITK